MTAFCERELSLPEEDVVSAHLFFFLSFLSFFKEKRAEIILSLRTLQVQLLCTFEINGS